MRYSVDDIEIFIVTHNRADYLVQSIQSILNQTVQPNTITVLDNESTDNTADIVKTFDETRVKYVKTFGFLGNYKKAKELASKKYVMLFHDDDILHPQYLALAIKALNHYDNIAIMTTRYTEFQGDAIPAMPESIYNKIYFFTSQNEFARHMYFIEHIAYATAIYRTDDFKKTPLEYEKFSKFNDWPLMVKMAACGNTVLFDDPKLYWPRRHNMQDTWTETNTPSLEQIVHWDKFFYDTMKISHSIWSVGNYMFRQKSAYFMQGKFHAFLSSKDKKKYSLTDLKTEAKRVGLYPSFRKKLWTPLLDRLARKSRFFKRLMQQACQL